MSEVVPEGFSVGPFTALGETRRVFRRGEGPPVLIMHEIPGVTPEVAAFARRVADAGFRVALPELFGTTLRPLSPGYALSGIAGACVSREFAVLSTRRRSPITDWLRVLARSLHEAAGGAGVGAIGMCLTGNFALALMLDEWLLAPVLSQPSLPFPVSAEHRRALHLEPGDLPVVCRRAQAGTSVLGLRFTMDALAPKERFDHLRELLGPEGFEGVEIDNSLGNPFAIPLTAHSVLTNDLVDREGHPTRAALDRVLAFLSERLRGSAPPT